MYFFVHYRFEIEKKHGVDYYTLRGLTSPPPIAKFDPRVWRKNWKPVISARNQSQQHNPQSNISF